MLTFSSKTEKFAALKSQTIKPSEPKTPVVKAHGETLTPSTAVAVTNLKAVAVSPPAIVTAETTSVLPGTQAGDKAAAIPEAPVSTIASTRSEQLKPSSLLPPDVPHKIAAQNPPARISVAAPAKKISVVDHPVAQHALTMLRNKHTAPHQYRAISNYLLVLLLAECTRDLPLRPETVPTFSDNVIGQVLAKPVVLLTVSRHGLGLANRMIEFFPDMMVGAIGFDVSKKGDRHELRLHLANAPALSDARVILFDPVVSTGSSSSAAIQLVRRAGATDISLVSFVMSDSGLARIQADFQNLHVWTAAIDAKCDARRGPIPGIGAFAERMHG